MFSLTVAAPLPALAQTAFPSSNPNATEWALIRLTPSLVSSARGGSGVIVGLYDGLADCRSADLAGRCSNLVPNTGVFSSYSTHGSHTAGTIAGARYGTATGATILNYAVFDSRGYVASGNGLIAAWTDAAKRKSSIASMSFGCARMALCLSASEIRTMASTPLSGMLFVKAAGNDGVALGNEAIPVAAADARTAFSRLLLVGSVNSAGTISSFSNRPGEGCLLATGATTCAENMKWKNRFLVAPGEMIYANLPGNTYGYMSGTSMATPVVTGAAALLEGRWPVLKANPATVADILLNSATDIGARGVDPVYGRGLLNVERAFQNAGTTAIVAPGGQKVVVSGASVTAASVMGNTPGLLSALTAFDAYGRDYALDQVSNFSIRSATRDPGTGGASAIDMGSQGDWAQTFFAGPSVPVAYVGFGPRAAAGSGRLLVDRTLRAGIDAPLGGAVVAFRLTGATETRSDFASDPGLRPLGFFASSDLLGRSALTGVSMPMNNGSRLVMFGATSLGGSPALGEDDGYQRAGGPDAGTFTSYMAMERSPLRQSAVGVGYWARPDDRTLVGVSVTSMVQRHGFYDLASDLSSFDAPVVLNSVGLAASRTFGPWEVYGAAETTAIGAPATQGPIRFSDGVLVSGEVGARFTRVVRGKTAWRESLAVGLRAAPQAVSGHLYLDYMVPTADGLETEVVHRQSPLADVTGRPVLIESSYTLEDGETWSARLRGGADLTGRGEYHLAAEARLTF
ncbi:S8 family peptidase [Brevundimonas subvibrioides]|uniref:S8 family peptidase n=1 Tax=Brevundimonas subvibrioides TaxID=74313 RepID=UPI0022B4763E|nr:S8 family serine peptidase [Brevundimonas subvibrioides]